jgi:hypothetical protein
MTFSSAIDAAALVASSSAQAQQSHPEESLSEATQLLASVPASQGAGAAQVATLKQDFTEFASAYLALPIPAPSATPGAVGTSGRADARADWRAKYQRVEADFAALLGPSGGSAPPASAAALDPDTRARLERVRSRLQIFYAATLSQPDGNPVAHTGAPAPRSTDAQTPARAPVAPTAQAPQTLRSESPAAAGSASVAAPAPLNADRAEVDTPFGTALAMLDRMERILEAATKDPDKVSIARADIDEMRAEIAQIRALLRVAR